jgi:Leucine-rich repeat (LRR) protein
VSCASTIACACAFAITVTSATVSSAEPQPKLPDDPSKLDCDWAGCDLVMVTDAARQAIETRTDRAKLVIRFARGSTDAGLATIRKLPWVARLDLDGKITDLSPLASLTHLEELVILDARPRSLAPIAALPALRTLMLHADVDLAPLRKMTGLRELHIDCETADCVAVVGELTWLTSLSVNNGFHPLDQTALAPIAKLDHLDDLSLMDTGLTNLSLITGLTKLRALNLQHNEKLVDIEGLRELPALEELTIQNGNGARKSKVLFELPTLKQLFVQDSLLSAKDKARLQAKRKDLRII